MAHDTDPPRTRRRYTARDAATVVFLAAVLLVLMAGDSPSRAAEEMEPGPIRSVVGAVGGPTGWVADRLPFAAAADQVAGWVRSDESLATSDGQFSAGGASAAGSSRIAPEAFSPQQLGEAAPVRALRDLLITGDSLSQPLDAELARRLASTGVRTERDPHIGTGISKTDLLDWGKLSAQQAEELEPDAVIVFIGANEGFPMNALGADVECCSAKWAAEYASRIRSMMDTYSRGGASQVYWLTLPSPKDPRRQKISRAVNAAIRVAAGSYGAAVRVVDTEALFTPGGRYRAAMTVGGREQLVRDPDGIHLNQRGSELLADVMQRELRAAFPGAGAPVEG